MLAVAALVSSRGRARRRIPPPCRRPARPSWHSARNRRPRCAPRTRPWRATTTGSPNRTRSCARRSRRWPPRRSRTTAPRFSISRRTLDSSSISCRSRTTLRKVDAPPRRGGTGARRRLLEARRAGDGARLDGQHAVAGASHAGGEGPLGRNAASPRRRDRRDAPAVRLRRAAGAVQRQRPPAARTSSSIFPGRSRSWWTRRRRSRRFSTRRRPRTRTCARAQAAGACTPGARPHGQAR